MDKQKQRIAIAEACGYVRQLVEGADDLVWIHKKDGDEWPYKLTGALQLPSYLSDLNAMHEAVKQLPIGKQWLWFSILAEIVSADQPAALGTAADWAQAFLRTIGKWEES